MLLSALSLSAQAQSAEAPPASEREVLLSVRVTTDHGLPINGLKAEQFKLTSEKKTLPITSFSDRDEPASIVFLVDVSGSMAISGHEGNKLQYALRGLQGFLQNGNDANEYSILAFHTESNLALDWTRDQNAVGRTMAKLALQSVKGQTAFYDACRQGMGLAQRGKHRRKIILLLSDGGDTASKERRFGKLKNEVRAGEAVFYALNIVSPADGSPNADGRNATEELTKLTGGQVFFPARQVDVDASFELLAKLIRNEYVVGFKTAVADDKWYEVKIEIKLSPDAPRELKFPLVKHRGGFQGNFDRVARTP